MFQRSDPRWTGASPLAESTFARVTGTASMSRGRKGRGHAYDHRAGQSGFRNLESEHLPLLRDRPLERRKVPALSALQTGGDVDSGTSNEDVAVSPTRPVTTNVVAGPPNQAVGPRRCEAFWPTGSSRLRDNHGYRTVDPLKA